MKLFIKKPIAQLMAASAESEKTLKRTLGVGSLIALGIGAIIGAGIFVRTAAAAGEHAGPAVTISFLLQLRVARLQVYATLNLRV
jgi:APA family basic amino acid/polyamine antiporter